MSCIVTLHSIDGRGSKPVVRGTEPSRPDGPRYKAIGNSKAVPVVRWIAKRITLEWRKSE